MNLPGRLDLARGVAQLLRYQDRVLWYRIDWEEVEHCDDSEMTAVHLRAFDFPIPVEDAGEGEFLPTMKCIALLRWSWKHREGIAVAIALAKESM